MAAVEDARAAAVGHEAVIVSHQLPIWTTRLHVERPAPAARPAAPAVHAVLADVAALRRRQDHPGELLRARRRPDPGQGQEGAVLGRRRARGAAPVTLKRTLLGVAAPLLLALTGLHLAEGTGDKGYITRRRQRPGHRRRRPRRARSSSTGDDLDGNPIDIAGPPRQGRRRQRVVARGAARAGPRSPTSDEAADRARRPGRSSSASTSATRRPTTALAFVRNFDVPTTRRSTHRTARRCSPSPAALTPRAIPTTVVLDDEGRVAASILGALPSTQTLVDLVDGRRRHVEQTADG